MAKKFSSVGILVICAFFGVFLRAATAEDSLSQEELRELAAMNHITVAPGYMIEWGPTPTFFEAGAKVQVINPYDRIKHSRDEITISKNAKVIYNSSGLVGRVFTLEQGAEMVWEPLRGDTLSNSLIILHKGSIIKFVDMALRGVTIISVNGGSVIMQDCIAGDSNDREKYQYVRLVGDKFKEVSIVDCDFLKFDLIGPKMNKIKQSNFKYRDLHESAFNPPVEQRIDEYRREILSK